MNQQFNELACLRPQADTLMEVPHRDIGSDTLPSLGIEQEALNMGGYRPKDCAQEESIEGMLVKSQCYALGLYSCRRQHPEFPNRDIALFSDQGTRCVASGTSIFSGSTVIQSTALRLFICLIKFTLTFLFLLCFEIVIVPFLYITLIQ